MVSFKQLIPTWLDTSLKELSIEEMLGTLVNSLWETHKLVLKGSWSAYEMVQIDLHFL